MSEREPKPKLKLKLEVFVNISIVIVALLLAYAVGKRFWFSNSQTNTLPEIATGSKVNLPGLDVSGSQQTIVLALQKGCHFCEESVPFYQQLTIKAREQGVRLIVATPQSIADAREYLDSLGLKIGDVRQVDLSSINVAATPTLMLLDRAGLVKKAWIGKLSGEREAEVFKSL